MILINLLPQELRVKERKKLNLPYRQVGVIVFIIFLIITLYNLFVYVRLRQTFRRLDAEWKSHAPEYGEAEVLEKELGAGILAEMDFYDSFVEPPLEAARLLNIISDLVPNSIWFDQLKFERNQKAIRLLLTGFSNSTSRVSKLIDIEKFTNELKEKIEDFMKPAAKMSSSFKKRIKVTVITSSQKSDTQDGNETIQFTADFKSDDFNPKK